MLQTTKLVDFSVSFELEPITILPQMTCESVNIQIYVNTYIIQQRFQACFIVADPPHSEIVAARR